ncbi:GSCOCG00012096001-RA-CDS [Cotesia congregata]|uniref:Uncharacterized protein n=1 Tax=Cotesia congregata TaxID=51543 RepID=A0A8J2H733_COTCN|nr:GSCOCG00012096001-RA-CDS [Cotesia congregata]CAG5079595.1 Protein of unknown function [Cotesia congregata]
MNLKIQFSASLCLFLILSGSTPISSQTIPTAVIDIAKYGWKAIQALIAIKSSINNHNFQQDVISALDEIRASNVKTEYLITTEADRIINVLSVKIDTEVVKDFIHIVYKINTRFEKQFLRYFTGNNTYENQTIDHYISTTINPNQFKKTLSLIKEYTVPYGDNPTENKQVFEVLDEYIKLRNRYYIDCKKYSADCINGKSGYDLIFNVFNLAITSISKGYTMVVHAYKYLQSNSTDPNAWHSELHDALDEYKETVLIIANAAKTVARIQSKAILRYDPIHFKQEENYDSLQFLTTFITDPRLLNNKQWFLDRVPPGERIAVFCDASAIYDCIDDNSIARACVEPPYSKRRYTCAIEIGGFKQYYKGRCAKNGSCMRDWGVELNIDIGFTHFKRCICEEDRLTKKGAHFNMSSQYSDFFNTNRVITGIRLVTKMSLTYFEIQHGVLVNGTIDNTTVSWDDRVSKKLDYMHKHSILPSYIGSNLHTLSYSNRHLNLDDIILPEGWVTVGVQFHLSPENHLSFEVAGIKIFDDLGIFSMSYEPHWFKPKYSERTELTKKNQDIPTFSNEVNQELGSLGKNYVKFQMTDWSIDASQTVYPFIDMQQVFTDPPAPVGGIGLYYKSQSGFGGFIAPKLISMNTNIFMSYDYLNNIFKINNSSNYLKYNTNDIDES